MRYALAALVAILVILGTSAGPRARAAETRDVSGIVYIDSNNNGVRDAGEKGAAGRTVAIDVEGNTILRAKTAYDGRYRFSDLLADGGYMIHLLTDENAPCGQDSYRPLLPDEDWSNIDIEAAEGDGEITGRIVNDLNENGQWDPGEPGEAHWSVLLQGSTEQGSLGCNVTVTSSSDGTFRIANLSAGSYDLMSDPPADSAMLLEYTYPTEPGDPYPQLRNTDFDVELPTGVKSARAEFGVHELRGQGTISADAFIDNNGNEIRDPGEPLLDCSQAGGIDLYRDVPGVGFVYVMFPAEAYCSGGVSSLTGLPAGAYGLWYPWWCTNPEQAGPPSHPDTPTLARVELIQNGSFLHEQGRCASDWAWVETPTPVASPAATPTETGVTKLPGDGQGAAAAGDRSLEAILLALVLMTLSALLSFETHRRRKRA